MQVEVIKLPYQSPYTEKKVDLIIPVAIPDLEELRAFAYALHEQGIAWHGDYGGWPAYYTPEDHTQKPPNSKQRFRPAEFWIGTDLVWSFTFSWEDGADEEPIEMESRYNKIL
ncbi:MAG: hypothetical protein U0175_04575 [Caldilineaceae bacterium]